MEKKKAKGWIGNMQEIFEKQQKAAKSYKTQAEKVLENEEERNKQLKRIADVLEAIERQQFGE